jgi:hypothetical protein
MSDSVESYRICCRCATVDLPDYIISDVRPSSDCHSVLDGFLRHFNINISQADLEVVVLIFGGRRLDIKASVGTVFGSVPVSIPSRILSVQVAMPHSFAQDPCIHVIIPPSSISVTKSLPTAASVVSPQPVAEIQCNIPQPCQSGPSEPLAPTRDAVAMLSPGAAVSIPSIASYVPFNDSTAASAASAYRATLDAWASYYERVSFEWLQRWGATRDPQALASHELAAHYARGCRAALSDMISNCDLNRPMSYQSSQFFNFDSPSRVDSSARAAEVGTAVLAADQQRAPAPHVDLLPLDAGDQAHAGNFVDPAMPANPMAGGAAAGAGLLALLVRAAVTMYAYLRNELSFCLFLPNCKFKGTYCRHLSRMAVWDGPCSLA